MGGSGRRESRKHTLSLSQRERERGERNDERKKESKNEKIKSNREKYRTADHGNVMFIDIREIRDSCAPRGVVREGIDLCSRFPIPNRDAYTNEGRE